MTERFVIDRQLEARAMEAHLAAITRLRIFSGTRRIAAHKWKRERNLVVAMEVFCVGSTYAHALCHEMGIDPDATTAPPRSDRERGAA